MSMKYKIGLTISAETLFSMIAKFLPVEDLSVEEILPQPIHRETHIPHIELSKKITPPKIAPPKTVAHVKGKHFSHPTGKPLVHFIEEYFLKNRDKTATWGELSHLSISLGFSKSSINNAITRLQERKIIERVGSGTYKLSDKKTQKSA